MCILLINIGILQVGCKKDSISIGNEEFSYEEYEFLQTCDMPLEDNLVFSSNDSEKNHLIAIRAEQILLKDNHIISSYDYEDFVESLDNENSSRQKLIASGQPVYGPEQYDARVYFDYIYSNARYDYSVNILGIEEDYQLITEAYINDLQNVIDTIY